MEWKPFKNLMFSERITKNSISVMPECQYYLVLISHVSIGARIVPMNSQNDSLMLTYQICLNSRIL